MSIETIASVVSAPGPINGNEHNSSPNFQFVAVPTNGLITINITNSDYADQISFTLWKDKSMWPDSEVATQLKNNSTISYDDVEVGDTYYIGDPSNANNQNFTVIFTANM